MTQGDILNVNKILADKPEDWNPIGKLKHR